MIQTINNVEELVAEYINPETKIVDTKVARLDTTGWESNFLRIDLTLKNEEKYTQEELNLIGKLITEDRSSDIKKEIGFYKIIIPILQDFEKQHGISKIIDCFPRFLGSKINLQSQNDTLLILENLQDQGYENARECDFPSTKLALENLARLHALPIALRSSKPDLFDRKLKPFLTKPPESSVNEKQIEIVRDIVKEGGYLNTSFKLEECIKCKQSKTSKEPFITLSHGDFWLKNILIKLEHGNPSNIKFLDFQSYSYDSLVKDLLFFLITSVQLHVLKENIDEFLEYYYEQLTKCLTQLSYSEIQRLTYELYLDEITNFSWILLPRILFTIMVIDERTESGNPRCPRNIVDFVSRERVSVRCKSKIWWIVDEFVRRGWINS